ncbi:MAG TPA: M23 family metallopeptidase [Ideonella sp.]|nr:M23 family metallopeptidase [Ideonella sp.]
MTASNPFANAATRAGIGLARRFARPTRGMLGAIAVVGAGFGAAAFGIAPLAPDAADLPKRLVTEGIPIEPVAPQLDALAAHALQLYRSDRTRSSDTADSLLRRLGADDPDAAAFLRGDPLGRRILEGRAGKMVQARVADDGTLESLVARYPAERGDSSSGQFTRLTVERTGDTLAARVETVPLGKRLRLGSGTIRSSLFAATDESDIPDAVATQLAEVFATDIDFHRELRRGDTFSVLYETPTADGEPVAWGAAGRVVAAEFVNAGRHHTAVWFKGAGADKGAYFGLDGKSKQGAFLASPLAFSRITSGFALRLHPILQQWRKHLGVDYAAPTGTPVRSVGDGVVEFAGWQNGYGNVVQIRHDGARATTYAHLSRIDVRRGERVDQGERIGAVGATGWATGPHLHFEFRVNGVHHDPLAIAKSAEASTIAAADRARFAELAQATRAQLAAVAGSSRLGQGE